MRCTCKTWTAKLWTAVLLLSAAPVAAQGSPPPQEEQDEPPAATDPATEARFLELKATGDAARTRGQLTRATQAYLEALAIRKDPTVHGRLGMVAAKARVYDAAAFHLLIALQRNGGTKAERAEFAAQFALVRPKVCLVHFEINVQGSDLRVDGRRFLARGGYDFYFVSPGAHTAHASAPGYKDASAPFEAPEGGETTVRLVLERPELPPASEPERIATSDSWIDRNTTLLAGPAAPADPPTGSSAEPEPPPFRAQVALGIAVSPYGLPSFGLGGNGMIGLRWQRFAVAADVRWLTTPASGIGDPPTPGRTSLLAVSLLPCLVAKIVDICGVVNASRLSFDLPVNSTTADGFSVGFGARVAARWEFRQPFSLIVYGEATGELRSLVLQGKPAADTGGQPVTNWRSPLARVNLGLALAIDIF